MAEAIACPGCGATYEYPYDLLETDEVTLPGAVCGAPFVVTRAGEVRAAATSPPPLPGEDEKGPDDTDETLLADQTPQPLAQVVVQQVVVGGHRRAVEEVPTRTTADVHQPSRKRKVVYVGSKQGTGHKAKVVSLPAGLGAWREEAPPPLPPTALGATQARIRPAPTRGRRRWPWLALVLVVAGAAGALLFAPEPAPTEPRPARPAPAPTPAVGLEPEAPAPALPPPKPAPAPRVRAPAPRGPAPVGHKGPPALRGYAVRVGGVDPIPDRKASRVRGTVTNDGVDPPPQLFLWIGLYDADGNQLTRRAVPCCSPAEGPGRISPPGRGEVRPFSVELETGPSGGVRVVAKAVSRETVQRELVPGAPPRAPVPGGDGRPER